MAARRTTRPAPPRGGASIDDVIEMVLAFADVERDMMASAYVDDEATFEAKTDAAQAFFWDAPGGTLLLSVGQPPGAGATRQNRAFAAKQSPRVLFMVKRHEHPTLGEVFAAYTSRPTPKFVVSFSEILYVARKRAELKIVSRYAQGFGPRARRWEHMGGEVMGRLRVPIEVRKLRPPALPDDRADYDAA